MNQHQFNVLLEKYRAGACTDEEQELLQAWSEKMLLPHAKPDNFAEHEQTEKRIWNRLRRNTIAPVTIARPLWIPWSVAATVLLLLGIGVFMYRQPVQSRRPGVAAVLPKGVIQIRNTSDKPRRVTLEDGSLVLLKVNSSISYPEHFGDKTRSVLLEGEAFFNVRKNPTKPFVVHTGELVTEVLGTSFTVRSYEHTPSIEVRVVTGRVSVYENATRKPQQTRNGVILTPNQRVVFDKTSRKMVPGVVENPVLIQSPAMARPVVFSDTPLPDVLREIEHAFGLEIVVENKNLEHCVITADLSELPFRTQIDLICKSVNATYEQRGTVIFINGEGCSK
ncbi:MAG: FecR domain-containing protein [Cytophagaceae bacterium]|nr:FecR domain-containing protein [Cytophagaceae bacterium]